MHYAITLGEGEIRLSPKQYLAALRTAQENPQAKFRHSFRDPRGWLGRSYTGAQIVAEHFDTLRDRWASWYPERGRGNRALKRLQAILDAKAECKWCGHLTGATNRQFCCHSCASAYRG